MLRSCVVLSMKLRRIVLSLGLRSMSMARKAIKVSVLTLRKLLKLRLLMSSGMRILCSTASIVTGLRIFMLLVWSKIFLEDGSLMLPGFAVRLAAVRRVLRLRSILMLWCIIAVRECCSWMAMKAKTLLSLMNSDTTVLSFLGCWAWSTGATGSLCLWKGVLRGGTLRLSCLRLLRLLLLSSLTEALMVRWPCVIIMRSSSVDLMLLPRGKNRFYCGNLWLPEKCVMSEVL